MHHYVISLESKNKEKPPVFSTKCVSALSRRLEGDPLFANLRKDSSFIGVNGPRLFGREIDVAEVPCFIGVLEPRLAKTIVFYSAWSPRFRRILLKRRAQT